MRAGSFVFAVVLAVVMAAAGVWVAALGTGNHVNGRLAGRAGADEAPQPITVARPT